MRKETAGWYFFVFLFAMAVFFPLDASAQIPAIEREALIALYNSTDGDNWTDNTGWKTPPLHTDGFAMPGTECNWYGVGADDSHVLRLWLYDNNLVGQLPSAVGNLIYLDRLLAARNGLTANVPLTLFTNLIQLEQLDVEQNQLTGMIPPEIGNLTNLRWLWLGSNQLSGVIPSELGNLNNLIDLRLNSNQLTGPIPPELGNLTNLTELWLFDNLLTGSIPRELGNLSKLLTFSLNRNKLSGEIPPEIGTLTNLTQISLRNNELTGSIPPELGNLANLERLFLYGNKLTGPIPSALGGLSNLEVLSLHSNYLTGLIPWELGKLSSLQLLLINNNRLIGPVPLELMQLTNLTDNESNFCANRLYTTNSDLRDFLNTKQNGGDWESCQVVLPMPDIKANNSDDLLNVSSGTLISIEINLNPGEYAGFIADWWIAVHTPFAAPGDWYTYVYPTGWMPGVHLCAQTGLFDLAPFQVLNMALPVGNYTFYFAIDLPDGIPTAELMDSVTVQVQ